MKLEYVLNENDEGKSINQILKEQFNFSSRLYSKLIKEKRIYKNNEQIDTRNIVIKGDKIIVDLEYEEDNTNIISKNMKLDIIYEDDGMLILNKPAGVAVHPSFFHYEDSLSSGVKFYIETIEEKKRIRPVSRLDLNTSGIIIIDQNQYLQECLIRQMRKKEFTKEYIACVRGKLLQKKGKINAPIARKKDSIIERCVSVEGQNAETEYEVLEEREQYSIVKCKLLTGRTHQIRVHFAYIGHSLLGDTLYGEDSDLIGRQALHCYKISFVHPITKRKIVIKSDLPSDFPG